MVIFLNLQIVYYYYLFKNKRGITLQNVFLTRISSCNHVTKTLIGSHPKASKFNLDT